MRFGYPAVGIVLLAGVIYCGFSAPAIAEATGPESQTPASQSPSANSGSDALQQMPDGFPSDQADLFTYGGEFNTHLQAEATKSTGIATKGKLFDDTDLPLYANYSNWLSFNSDVKLERQRDDNEDDYFPNRNAFLRSEGLTLRQLYTTITPTDDTAIYGGKIHPAFGSA